MRDTGENVEVDPKTVTGFLAGADYLLPRAVSVTSINT